MRPGRKTDPTPYVGADDLVVLSPDPDEQPFEQEKRGDEPRKLGGRIGLRAGGGPRLVGEARYRAPLMTEQIALELRLQRALIDGRPGIVERADDGLQRRDDFRGDIRIELGLLCSFLSGQLTCAFGDPRVLVHPRRIFSELRQRRSATLEHVARVSERVDGRGESRVYGAREPVSEVKTEENRDGEKRRERCPDVANDRSPRARVEHRVSEEVHGERKSEEKSPKALWTRRDGEPISVQIRSRSAAPVRCLSQPLHHGARRRTPSTVSGGARSFRFHHESAKKPR
jgi:hypothetical protein